MSTVCINYKSCPLVNNEKFVVEKAKLNYYISTYCQGGQDNWSSCKRYLMKLKWHFCPDFVLPDTPGTTYEIVDKFEEE